eukprot:TRINITY_DN14149_c0_g1_i2.p1 TRINITY_DN14149_c0_g1~~TRINITY_DN14149_c0_g1_i2.p1  ORF type:complete len:621 (+),score=223.82 TRINITY_DN14149_c0_g1_i2:109-1863(+)
MLSTDRRKREGHASDDRGFNRYRARNREKEEDRDRRDRDKRDRRRRRRDSSDSRERDDSRRRRDRDTEMDTDESRGGGFRPAPWMNSGGQRPGENAAPPIDNTTRPEIQLCGMAWDDQQTMDTRVGGLVPHTTEPSLSERFNAVERNEERDEEAGKLQHLATLQELGVPVKLLYPQLDELCAEYGIKVVVPEDLYVEEVNTERRQFFREERGGDGAIENQWAELPMWSWNKNLSLAHVNNKASAVLLLALVPQELNNEESLRGHFQRFGNVSQIITRINYRPKHVKQGLAIVQMANLTMASMAYSSQDPVCGNRFVKVFFAPDAVRKKVESITIEKMLQDRRDNLERQREKLQKKETAQQQLVDAKARVAGLQAKERELTQRLAAAASSPEAPVLQQELQSTARALRDAFKEQLAAMELIKSSVEKTSSSSWRPKNVGYGVHTYDARTTAFKLPVLPGVWLKSPAKLRKAMDRYGEVVSCCIGKRPPQGFVRFRRRWEAERAVKALEDREHKPVWMDRWDLEWPQESEIMIVEEEPPQEVKPAVDEVPKDDDEALIEEELGLRGEEFIPVAKEGVEDVAMGEDA